MGIDQFNTVKLEGYHLFFTGRNRGKTVSSNGIENPTILEEKTEEKRNMNCRDLRKLPFGD